VLAEVPLKKETKVIAYYLYRPTADCSWRIYDLIVDGAMEELEGTDSRFVEEDFPFAETWWWTYSAFEIQNSWLIDFMTNIFSSSPAPRLAKSEYS